MHRKHIVCILTALLLAFALLSSGTTALAASCVRSNQKLTVDGMNIACEKYNIDGYNSFKLRDLACMLRGTGSEFSVSYDDASRVVSVVTGENYTPKTGDLEPGEDKSATAVKSSQTIMINGKVYSGLSVYNIGGNNYFKLAEIGPILNFGVDYDKASRTAQITSHPKSSGGQTPTPEPTAAPIGARLAETPDAGREYLDKIIFLGDSTTYGIGYYYRLGYTALCPPSQVWTPASGTLTLSYYSIATIVYPETKEEISIEEAVKRAKPEIMVITLGVNGISFMDEEWFIRDYTALVQMIQAASPDTKIILNSIYPVADSYKYQKDINNTKINAANGWIERIAESTGVRFLYSYECLVENGKLPESAQNGDGLHLTGESFTKVMQYIRTHAYT